MGFIQHKSGELVYYTSENMGELSHIFTTRHGGVSEGSLNSLNLGTGRDDKRENLLENYKRACETVDIDYRNCVLAKQTHTSNIRIVTKEDAGKGLMCESDIRDTDGLITAEKNLPLVIFYADCVPVLLYDRDKKVLACLHAGWRGTVAEIAGKGVEIMREKFGCENISAAIGPSIGECCFETGLSVAEEFVNGGFSEFIRYKNDKAYIDLWGVNEKILKDAGVVDIAVAKLCTVCNKDEFFSHRGCGSDTGRMALIAEIK